MEGRQLLATFTVLNTNDSGPDSLRQAMLDANALPGADTIGFDIPGAGVQTIAPLTALPTITDPVTIDGDSQPGSVVNTDGPGLGDDAVPLIELSGVDDSGDVALVVTAGDSSIRGMVINQFSQAILLETQGGNVVAGDFIGTDAAGTAPLPNGGQDTGKGAIDIFKSTANTIGGTTAADRNIISGNNGQGLSLEVADENVVQGNLIGTDATGTIALGNVENGVEISASGGNTFGGTVAGARNVISGNGRGMVLTTYGSDVATNVVQGNFVGTDVTGTAPLANQNEGIYINEGVSIGLIGGTETGAGNTIAFNLGPGVSIIDGVSASGTRGNAILGNSIFSNGAVGIDLGGDGATPNTPGGPHAGPNELQNNPVLTSVVITGTETVVTGTLNSDPNAVFDVQFFGNDVADASGYGQGKVFLGEITDLTTDADGNVSFTASLPTVISPGQFVAATATDTSGDTSEFSQDIQLPVVNTLLSTTTLSVPPDPTTVGQPVTITATVTVPQGDGVATGTVTFLEGSTSLGTGTLDGGGVATFSTSSLAVGVHTITADYGGDPSFAASSSSPVDVTVDAPSTTTLTISPTTADLGQPVTFTAIVSTQDDSADAGKLAGGYVTFQIVEGTTIDAPPQLVDSQDSATLTISTLPAGHYYLIASYGGDSTFAASSSSPEPFTISDEGPAPISTTTTLTASPTTADLGQPVTFTAIVGPQDPSVDPTALAGESVQFTIDEVTTTVVPLQDIGGQEVARLTTSTLATGTHAVTASFAGDGTIAPSASNSVRVSVAAPSPTPTPTAAAPAPAPIPVVGPAVATDGPLVMDFQRFGYHSQPTVLVLNFNKALDPATASDPANYMIVPVGRHGKSGHPVAVSRIAYDPSARTVTLRPSRRLNVHHRFELVVDGTSAHGLVDLALQALDGGETGKAGSDYVGQIDWKAIAGPSLPGGRYARAWRNLVASGIVGR